MINRRDFIKSGLVVAAATAIPATVSADSGNLLWSHTSEARWNRKLGVPPRFNEVHRCVDCKRDFYCPDRWTTERCEVKAYWEARGWSTDRETCLPCRFGSDLSHVEAANMAAWWEAHRV